MTEQPAPHGPTTTLPPQSANGTSAQLPPASNPRKSGPMHSRISGMRTSRFTTAGTTRITQLRQIMRRDRRKPPTS
jgi:hypothetical protein